MKTGKELQIVPKSANEKRVAAAIRASEAAVSGEGCQLLVVGDRHVRQRCQSYVA